MSRPCHTCGLWVPLDTIISVPQADARGGRVHFCRECQASGFHLHVDPHRKFPCSVCERAVSEGKLFQLPMLRRKRMTKEEREANNIDSDEEKAALKGPKPMRNFCSVHLPTDAPPEMVALKRGSKDYLQARHTYVRARLNA